ncbi:hypothetical protein XENOCAPTIV_018623 [Xenoophorus captivus]|uniref:Uncharacterized protein n=1 Tax=Xenoophorus captivus TaxID=1517983 RepID=A0ABV0QMA6_9TELE
MLLGPPVQKDQLNLQSVDITSLRDSLQVEQQRYRQLWEDRETVVTRLHSQIRQLQQSRDDYYTKNQELQETQMLQLSHMKEVDTLRQSLLAQGQKLEAAHQRVAELENHLSKKEHLIAEQKKFLEDVKCQAK